MRLDCFDQFSFDGFDRYKQNFIVSVLCLDHDMLTENQSWSNLDILLLI